LGLVAAGTVPDWLAIPAGVGALEAAHRAASLSAALDQLNISTIHGYCLALLRAESLAAGLHPGFAVDAEGSRVREAVRAELADWLPEAATSPAMGRLVAAGSSLTQVGEALVMLVTAGVEAAELALPGAEEGWQRRLAELGEALAALVEVGGGLARVSARSSLTLATWEAVVQTRSLLEIPGQGELEAALARLTALWPENCRARLRDWGRGEWSASERAALGEAVGEATRHAGEAGGHLEPLLTVRPAQLAAAAGVLGGLLERVQERLRRSGVVTFEGLLRGAERLLACHPAVAARERARLQQVLVDEFQDTDQVQCQLVARLCLEGPPGQRPGLFVVGDPKQSIYAWRSADLAAYETFVAQVKDAGGEVHPLSVNFRSVPAILAEVERVIAPAMVEKPGVQPAFQPLLPCPE
ncbi:MAG: UvrD-helicase domain-containing protein, partial [Acidobacteriota bacterium]